MDTPIIPRKRCSKCKEFKDLSAEFFPRNKNSKDGFHTWCKTCQKEYNQSHPEIIEKAKTDFKERNPTYHAEAVRKHRQKYPDKTRQRKKDYAKKYPEKVSAISKRKYQKHKEEIKSKRREYTLKNNEIINEKDRARNKKRYLMNPSEFAARSAKRRAILANATGTHTALEIMGLYEEQERRCGYCGVTIYWNVSNDVHIDHVQPLSKGGSNDIGNITLACSKCNLSKSHKTLTEWMNTRGW